MTTTTITSNIYRPNENDSLQFILTFICTQGGVNDNYSAETEGIIIKDWGTLEWNYDVENPLMVPGTYEITLSDMNGLLFALLYDFSGQYYKKNFQVEIKLNGNTEYIGDAQEDDIHYYKSNKTVKISFDPNTSIINKTLLYQDNGTANNQFGLVDTSYYRFTYLLEKIFGLVDSSISYANGSLTLLHNWIFQGKRFEPTYDNNVLSDINMSEIFQLVHPLFFDNTKGCVNMGDVLKKLAIDWCCFTGLIHKKKAFFKKLFTFNPNNLQTLGRVLNQEVGYKYSTIDYVKAITNIGSGMLYTVGTDTKLEGRTIVRDTLPGFFNTSGSSGSNINAVIERSSSDDGNYHIWKANDSTVNGNGFNDNGYIITNFWYNWRSNIANLRVDTFSVVGIHYDFLKDFIHNSEKFQPISMKKYLAANRTEIEAIHLGRLQ